MTGLDALQSVQFVTKKGKRLAGRYGTERVTIRNLRVVKIDAEKKVILVEGAIPGCRGGLVYVTPAKKKVNKVKK